MDAAAASVFGFLMSSDDQLMFSPVELKEEQEAADVAAVTTALTDALDDVLLAAFVAGGDSDEDAPAEVAFWAESAPSAYLPISRPATPPAAGSQRLRPRKAAAASAAVPMDTSEEEA